MLKPDSPSIFPVAQRFKNNPASYRSYSHHEVCIGDLPPEQFLGTSKREIMIIIVTLITPITITIIMYSFFSTKSLNTR